MYLLAVPISGLQIFGEMEEFDMFWLELHCYMLPLAVTAKCLETDTVLCRIYTLNCTLCQWPGEEEFKDDKFILFPDCQFLSEKSSKEGCK